MEHAFKLYEILDGRLHGVVVIDKIQYGFTPGIGTVDAVLALRRLTEKFGAKNKKLFFALADLEKAFDHVSREVIHFVLRQTGVQEYLVGGAITLCKGCKTVVSADRELSNLLSVKVGVHHGSALSPFSFIMVIDVLTEDVRDGSLMELLHGDDLILRRKSLDEIMEKYW